MLLPFAVAALALTSSPTLPAELDELVRTGLLGQSHSGIEVYSLDDGKIVFGSHDRDLLNPASNTKIFTSAAALSRLGPDYRWVTEIYLDAPLSRGVERGNLIVRGKGDPTLVSERLWEIVGELRHQGLREVHGDLVLDDSYFDQVVEGPGWDQEKTDRAYLAPISALASNWGSFAIYVSPTERAGQKARVEIDPPSPYFKLESEVVTGGRARHITTSGWSARDGYHVRVRGRIPAGAATAAFWRRVGDPTLYTGETLKELLAERGIHVTGRVRRGRLPPAARLFFASESDSLDVVLKRLNKQSSNFVAEMILKTLAAEVKGIPGSWQNGVEAVAEFLEREVGIPRGSYVMKNGSGLNDVNRFSADQVVRVLSYVYYRMPLAPEFISSLPIAGKDGTVRFRMEDTAAAGRVRVKTGTLEDVTALSGYAVSLGGRHFAFSLLVNDFPSSLRKAIAAEDAFAVAIASAGGHEGSAAVAGELPDDPEAAQSRARVYLDLARAEDPSAAQRLRAVLRTERSPALRSLAAAALYESLPDEPEAVEALVDSLPSTAPDLAALIGLASAVGEPAPLVSSLVELASDGETRGLAALLGFAALEPPASATAFQAALEGGLADVALQAPRELLDALAEVPRAEAERDVHRLARGLARNPPADARFAEALTDAATGTTELGGLAKRVQAALAEARTAASIHSVENPAVPRRPSGVDAHKGS
ncbi:MAG: D-alanyl-D-alanine carboxypeptidase/D-alanyl-D-alanine endopeptidase [Deltaproteobacteria bacterium]